MLIILCIVIICCTVSINNKISWICEWIDWIKNELFYVESSLWKINTTAERLSSIDDRLKNIGNILDPALDDILYYMPKNK